MSSAANVVKIRPCRESTAPNPGPVPFCVVWDIAGDWWKRSALILAGVSNKDRTTKNLGTLPSMVEQYARARWADLPAAIREKVAEVVQVVLKEKGEI